MLLKGSKVSLYIQNSKGTTVKKLISNKAWSGGKVTASWDGKLDSGKYATDGTYKVLAKVSGNGNTLYKSASLKVVGKVVPSIKLSGSAVYSPPIKGKLAIPYELNKSAKVTAQIKDKNSKVIKTILSNSSVSAGKKTIYWDGKDTKGKKVSDGSYTLVMSVIDADKLKGTTRKFMITVDATSPKGKPSLTPAIFKMDGAVKNIGKIDVNETVYMTAYVTTDKGVKIKKLINNKNIKKGALALTWDGKNEQKQFVNEGKYNYLIELRDVAGNKATVKSALFTLEDWNKPIEIEYPTTVQWKYDVTAEVYYKLSQPAKVTVEIYDGNTKLRTIMVGKTSTKGINSFEWDGYDDDDNHVNGDVYTYKIKAINNAGKETTITGKITNDDPDWLIEQNYSFTSLEDNNSPYTHLNLELNVNQPVKLLLYVFDDEYSDEYEDFIEKNLLKGTNNLVYAKVDIEDHDDYYLLVYTDSLGNEYYYDLDENSYDDDSIDTPQFESDVNRELVEQLN